MTVTHHGTHVLPVGDLHPHADNPNHGDVAAIRESLDEFGQYRSVVALEDGTLLAGHHVWQAAKARGDETIRVEVIETDEHTARRILLADNRIAELGDGLDPEALLAVLESLGGELAGTGYDEAYLDELEALLNLPEVCGDPDAPPHVPKTAGRVKKGQSWRLGPHRLLVGDATDTDRVLAWLGEDRVDAVWTDPPYGVEYVGKTKDALRIENDGAAGLGELLAGAYRTIVAAARPGAPVYIAHADTERVVFETRAREAGLLVRQNLVWVKNTIVLGRSDYHYRHEPVLYGFTPGGSGRLGRGGPNWHGDNKQATTFFVDKPDASRDHPTMKPVELITAMLNNSCRPGGLVLDVFGGSGSTMAAAHITARRAALVELDPRYAEAILARYEALSGDTAVKE